MKKLPVVLHIPHASRSIPEEFLPDILLDAAELETELLRMTDAYTEEAAAGDWAAFVLQAPVSRLVDDVERFRGDESEPMSQVGMGAVYTRTHDGRPLRAFDPARREAMLRLFYDLHHAQFAWTVNEMLQRFPRCLIIDVHSFPSKPLPYEPDQTPQRPDICIGTDSFHTPPQLADAALGFFAVRGWSVRENSPFAGSIVPLPHYGKERRVASVMVEINRSLIMDEATGARKESASGLFGLFPALAKRLLAVW